MAHDKESSRASRTKDAGPLPGDSTSPVRMFVAAMVALFSAVGALWVSGAGDSNWIAAVLIIIGLLAILDLGIGTRERLGSGPDA
ncbi:MAG: hypothetical protein WA962_03485 [Ornithinimicrobium sp.]